jgi:flagellar protein FliS
MILHNPYAKYQNIKVSTVNRGPLLLMVYDAAIRYLDEARSCMSKQDFSGKGIYLDRAFAAINELRVSLNYDHDPKLASALNQLYFFMTKQLSKATLKNDQKSVQVVIDLLKGLRLAWEQAVNEEKPKSEVKSLA